MINYHPCDNDLVDFAEGGLPTAKSIMVSAHCDLCKHCDEKVKSFTDSIANQIFSNELSHPTIGRNYIEMFDEITSQANHSTNVIDPSLSNSATLELSGRQFELPETLHRFVDRIGECSHLLGKLWQAPVDLGSGQFAQFIYMEDGGNVPEHTHKGSEYTLVIDGAFKDGLAQYDSGDFIELSQHHTHSPSSTSKDGCLVFSIIDQPLYFTSGWARLINPLSHLYFNTSTSKN